MNRDEPIKRLIELAESLNEQNQEKLACVAQGMAMASRLSADNRSA